MELDAKTRNAIMRECRKEAKEIVQEKYKLYDDIWYTRIKLDNTALAHGKDTITDICRLMPNLFVKSPFASSLDLVSQRFGFECESDLIDFLLAYKNRGPAVESLAEKMFQDRTFVPAVYEDCPDLPF